MSVDSCFKSGAAVSFPFFVGRNTNIEQGVPFMSQATFGRNAGRDFIEPPEIDAIDGGDRRRSAHYLCSTICFVRIKIEH